MNGDIPTSEYARQIMRLVTRLERQRRRYINDGLAEQELVGSMYRVTLLLDREPGISQEQVVEELQIDKGNVARRVRRMEELGYLRREQDPEDRRRNRLFLTDAGRELLPLIRRRMDEWGAAATQGMTQEERRETLRLLTMMQTNVAGTP